MRRLVTWLAGGLGAVALVRELLRRQPVRPPAHPSGPDPAEELRAKLEQARETADDRDEFDAAEGTPVDEIERPSTAESTPVAETESPPAVEDASPDESVPVGEGVPADETERQRSLEERRQAVHEKAQQALGHMRGADDE